MPTYAYRCTQCGHAFDIYQSFTDDALTVCPECEGALRKVLSPVGVVFKGSGFYVTDHRNNSTLPGTRGEKSGESKADGKSEPAKTETSAEAPAAKPEAPKAAETK